MYKYLFFFNFFARPTNWAPQSSQGDTDPTIAQEEKSFSLKGKCPKGQDVPGAGMCLGQGKQHSRCGGDVGLKGVIRHSQSRGLPGKGHRQEATSIQEVSRHSECI